MKKIILTIITFVFSSIAFTGIAQEISKNTIGLRIGDNNGIGPEISYQRHLNENNRIEANLGWRNSRNIEAFKLVGLYQWVEPIDGNFNWYYGAGAGIGTFNTDNARGAFALITGDIGIEYNFDFPLLVSLDFRPELGFNDDFNNGLDFDIALGLRYQF